MRLPEQRLWDRMRKGMSEFPLYLERLENMLGSGMPDVRSLKDTRVCYLELKVARDGFPKRESTPLLGADDGLRLAQRNWLLNWTKHGGKSYVVIGIEGSKIHMALNGSYADHINKLTYKELCEIADVVGVTPVFWDLLQNRL